MARQKSVSLNLNPIPLRFLTEFKEYCRLRLREKRALISAHSPEVSALIPQVRPLLSKETLKAAEQRTVQEFARYQLESLDATDWLELYEAVCVEISQTEPEQIDAYQANITPLCREFVARIQPLWEEELRSLIRLCESFDEPVVQVSAVPFSEFSVAKSETTTMSRKAGLRRQTSKRDSSRKTVANKTSSAKASKGEVTTVKSAIVESGSAPVADSAFRQNEDGSYEMSPVQGEDYRDEVEEEWDEEENSDNDLADEDDLRFSSADPSTSAPSEPCEVAAEVRVITKPPREVRYRFKLAPHCAPDADTCVLFDDVASQIFAEFGVDEEVGATYRVLKFINESARQEYFASQITEGADGSPEAERHFVTRVQTSIINIFNWAMKNDHCNLETILDEIRADLTEDKPKSYGNLNEFTHHSSGDSKFLLTQMDYEGRWDDGASLRDGFSIQTAQRVLRPYSF